MHEDFYKHIMDSLHLPKHYLLEQPVTATAMAHYEAELQKQKAIQYVMGFQSKSIPSSDYPNAVMTEIERKMKAPSGWDEEAGS